MAARWVLALVLAVVAGCAGPSLPKFEDLPRPPPQHALPAQASGAFAGIEARLRAVHGPEASGFALLDSNEDALRWRLALIDSARHSIDLQYYLFFGDAAGNLLLERLLAAADRGVRVRLLLDDLSTLLQASGDVEIRDRPLALIDAHPKVELRLFNPWRDRSLLGRAGEAVADLERLNQRMHNKAMVVDNQAAILGGRNIGDEYMGLAQAFNFHDLDVLGVGPVARQTSAVFDAFWNSEWVLQAKALKLPTPPADVAAARRALRLSLRMHKSLDRFDLDPRPWTTELAALAGRLHPGTSRVHSDLPRDGHIEHVMLELMNRMSASARRELLVVNAYIIPDEDTIAHLGALKARGVDVRVLTNSLGSQDVPAVNSHYKSWRRALRAASSGLYELRHDAALQAGIVDTPPTRSAFASLHSKAMVVDRERLYIGSMNFDPRSALLNTEMGVVIDSPPLARALAAVIERGLAPANSWRVEVDDQGRLSWAHDGDTLHWQPARNFWQRVEDVVFMLFPKELY